MRSHSVGCGTPNRTAIGNAIGYAKFFSRSRDAVIRVYDEAGNVMETQEQAGDFKDSFSSGFLTVLQKTSPATQQPMGLENRFDCHSSLQQKLIAMSRTPTLVRKLLRHKIMLNSSLIRLCPPTGPPLLHPHNRRLPPESQPRQQTEGARI